MADITLNFQTTSIPRTQSSVYGARSGGAANVSAAGQTVTTSALGPTTTVVSSIATDVLLAAQQAREPDRPRGFDVRAAYDRTSRRPQEELDPRDLAADRVNPDDGGPQGSAASARPSAVADNVVRLFSGSAEQASTETSAARDRAEYSRANQAYVGAGAADGLAFARAGVDTSLRPATIGFDIII